jgi:hypothetical protein
MCKALYEMDKLILMIASFISLNSFAEGDTNECTRSKAFTNGMLAIKESYPTSWNSSQPYKIEDLNDDSWIVLGTISKVMLGGTPEVIVSKEKCEIENVYHTQ